MPASPSAAACIKTVCPSFGPVQLSVSNRRSHSLAGLCLWKCWWIVLLGPIWCFLDFPFLSSLALHPSRIRSAPPRGHSRSALSCRCGGNSQLLVDRRCGHRDCPHMVHVQELGITVATVRRLCPSSRSQFQFLVFAKRCDAELRPNEGKLVNDQFDQRRFVSCVAHTGAQNMRKHSGQTSTQAFSQPFELRPYLLPWAAKGTQRVQSAPPLQLVLRVWSSMSSLG